jgi:metallophosphoesterase (TIGR03767 family)
MPTTLERTISPGAILRPGKRLGYRRLRQRPGAPRRVRDELGGAGARGHEPGRGRSLCYLAQVSDIQLADVASPGRFEFLEALRGLPGTRSFLPAQRPQEALVAPALDAMLREIGSLDESRDTGAALSLALSTGDNLDNAQWNELCWHVALFGGGAVTLGGAAGYEGVQADDWPGELFWRPGLPAGLFQVDYGFPTLPSLLGEAFRPFDAGGLAVPWLSCFGNHDGLVFGESVPTAQYHGLLLGSQKAVALPPGLDPLSHEEELFSSPELFLAGPRREVRADPERRPVGRREFVGAHLGAPGLPKGHGYREENLELGTTYFAYEATPEVRLIVLDTANLDGHHAGSIGRRQFEWLEERLTESHVRCLSEDGRTVQSGGEDRLVVLASHHGLTTLSNDRQLAHGREEDQPRVLADEVARLVHRFPNVILWLNGHRHLNEIVAHHSPWRQGGFYEISTASIADWPSQGRLVELLANPGGTVSVLTTMVDHAGPLDPDAAAGVDRLAALHRELAANAPGAGFGSPLAGRPQDRNAELIAIAPFSL